MENSSGASKCRSKVSMDWQSLPMAATWPTPLPMGRCGYGSAEQPVVRCEGHQKVADDVDWRGSDDLPPFAKAERQDQSRSFAGVASAREPVCGLVGPLVRCGPDAVPPPEQHEIALLHGDLRQGHHDRQPLHRVCPG